MSHVPDVPLNNGVAMPILGFGVYQIDRNATQAAVEAALEVGYRHIDTAALYGNETEVGLAIAATGIPREQLFITTKLWPQKGAPGTIEDATRRAFEESMAKLGLDYLDLYLIHQPYGDLYAEWRAMTGLHQSGAIRAIGVSNFYGDRLVDLLSHNEVVPAVNQIETHPYFQRAADQEFMAKHGVQIESWGPFAEGANEIFTNAVLTRIGADHGKSVAQVILRWLIQRGVVAIPKTVNPHRMAENFAVFDFALSPEEMDSIATLDTGATVFFDHRDPGVAEGFGKS